MILPAYLYDINHFLVSEACKFHQHVNYKNKAIESKIKLEYHL